MRRGSTSGLSLLETLISLALLASMTALIAGTLDYNRRVWERGAIAENAALAGILRRDLQLWLEWATFRATGAVGPVFAGDAEGFAYGGGVARDGFDGVSAAVLTLDLVRSGGRVQPQVGVTLTRPEAEAPLVQSSGMISAALSDASITYYGRQSQNDPLTWHPNWTVSDRPPVLIKITGIRPNGTPIPPLVIKPREALAQRRISLSSPLPPG